ncbi:LYSM4 protein, partial [Regulus satrapa]|nr:LYSM4 protein [Regulus satrapa]
MRLNESRTRPFQGPAAVHTFQGRQLYVFPSRRRSDSEESSEEEELTVMELRPRGREQQQQQQQRDRLGDVVLLERELGEEDSLNKLALQYGCKVSAASRGSRWERDPPGQCWLRVMASVGIVWVKLEESKKKNTQTNTKKLLGQQPGEGAAHTLPGLLSSFISDAVQVEVQLKAEHGGEGLERPPPEAGKRDPANGADCGIQWWNAVFIMLLIGIVLPVFYIIYFKTQGLVAHTFNVTSNVSTAG